ncbi:MAG: NAD-dependent succinate-semialdehyde dehydrogenase [Flavobacterium sp.]|uniref:NAD-dependent succinate-semialdehyde dehydrogenase n=1 Tax=unclassified Flavobacterium TaxID=196869 RepID=UPI000C1861FE|nr:MULTISPECIES: NAD-dependent succinate-semialdehyde dehydrogenase [unclassified Flavobacterium]MDP3680577.1 NAD-dependent succinate-semialdehyde dehydrogenase [Flavobacterium sp.]MDZ4331835.1 NAD-dependent succinate-semialdehyde dehydrogenase [Flavobacterium sp.]PIF63429.1 succinate-semialdehyde dehydrogenase/glutarate-semialdehyde dehydrogenase [Flavobacterium sp. 11]
MVFKSINPFSQLIIAEHEVLTNAQLNQKVQLSERAFKNWKQTTFEQRAERMKKLANILREKKEELGLLITNEMGKVLSESISEVEKSAGNCDFYAENAEKMLKDEYYDTPFKSMSVYDPMGTVFAIMPWNYPFWQVLRYAAPAIMAGNVTLLKHAPNVIGCAKAIENAFLEAGFPEGVFQQITIDIPQVESVIAADIVHGVTLTGSEMAGSSVASLAGKHIKKSVMELGGSDAFIVLNDANLEKAATVATQSRMLNAGQACICAKRFIVTEKVADEFTALFTQKIKSLQQGNPLQQGINMGPLARIDLAEKLANQLEKSLQQGAKLIVGGEREDCNFQPTLIDFVDSNNIAFQEETFGPLATVIRAKDENDAITIANNHRYGLASAIWTEDRENAYRLARRIEAGNVFVNSLVRSDSRVPFGGIKKSGYGRELGAIGIKEFMNMKSLIIE